MVIDKESKTDRDSMSVLLGSAGVLHWGLGFGALGPGVWSIGAWGLEHWGQVLRKSISP